VPEEKIVRRFDVLVNSTGIGTLGRVAQVFNVPRGATIDTHVTIVRPQDGVDPHFFGMQLLALQGEFERAGTGSTGQTELARGSISGASILIPPTALQNEFGRLVGSIRDEAEVLLAQNRVLRDTRDLLLPKMISGEINLSVAEKQEVERAPNRAAAE
jgi:type I restriction enzyme S subunit